MSLRDFKEPGFRCGSVTDGFCYRWAKPADMEATVVCVRDAEEDFAVYYQNAALYKGSDSSKVLIAVPEDAPGEVAGALIVSLETEAKRVGSIGCTAVATRYRGRHIAVNLVILGTDYLKVLGMKKANLSYTYSGLDHMYGYAGYKIKCYYMMAKKRFSKVE